MFNTWKINPETNEVQNIRQSWDPISARSSQHQACNRCHEKKLKCSGEKDGCDRCVAGRLNCEYNRSGSRRSKTSGSHSGGRSSETSSRAGRESTNSPGSQTSSLSHSRPSKSSSSGSKSHKSDSSSRTSRPKSHHSSSHGHGHGPDSALDQLDMSLMSPDFGMNFSGMEYTPVSAPHYTSQAGYSANYDAWSTSASYGTLPATCAAIDASSYVATTNAAHPYPAQQYQDYRGYDEFPDQYWGQGR